MKLKIFFITAFLCLWTSVTRAATPPINAPSQVMQTQTVISIGPSSDEALLKAHIQPGDPLRANCLFFLGIKAHENNQMSEAKAYLEQALAHAQESVNPQFIQMVSLAALGVMDIEEDSNYTAGKTRIEQSLTLIDSVEPQFKPAIAELYATYADALYSTGHLVDANRMLKKAFVLDPDCEGCRMTLSDLQKADPGPDYFQTQLKELMRWNDETHLLRVYLSSGEGLKDWNPSNLNLAMLGLQKWEQASAQRFQFEVVTDPSLADVRLQWSELFIQSHDGNAIGMNIPDSIDTTLVKNDIVICLHDDLGRHLSQDEIGATVLHELGHMLGIQGHSPNWSDVMAASSVTNIISNRDIATLNRIYANKPVFTNPVGISLAQYRQQTLPVDKLGIIIPK
jgi:tetratricopeptide (TPR) repeat protein